MEFDPLSSNIPLVYISLKDTTRIHRVHKQQEMEKKKNLEKSEAAAGTYMDYYDPRTCFFGACSKLRPDQKACFFPLYDELLVIIVGFSSSSSSQSNGGKR